MAYIGKTPTVGNFVKLDAITASATASYTMQVDSVNFSPESVNHMLVSLNGVIQAPTTSYTISGSTITFASALTSSDSIDFIMVYGNVLDIGTPSDATISTAKIIDNAVTGAKFNADVISSQTALGAEPSDTDEFLVSDAGVLKRVDYSHIKGGGGLVYVGGASVVNTNTSQVNVDSVFSSTYRNYRIFIEATSNTQTDDIRLKLRNSSGDISVSTELYTILSGINNSGSQQAGTQAQASYWRIFENTASQANTDYPMGACEITIYAPNVSTDITHMTFVGSYKHSGGEERARYGSLILNNQQAVTGLALVSSSGSINDAQIKVYGMVDS